MTDLASFGRSVWLRGLAWIRATPPIVLLLLVTACAGPPSGGGPSRPSVPASTGGAVLAPARLLVYGGMGELDRRAQPLLNAMLAGKAGGTLPSEVFKSLQGRTFPGLSPRPIVLSTRDVEADLEVAAGGPGRNQARAVQALIDDPGTLALILVGSHEDDSSRTVGTTVQQTERWVIVTVTAVVARPGAGRILLTQSATTVIDSRSRGGSPQGGGADIEAGYRDAATRVLDLIDRTTRTGLPAEGLTMVTGVQVDDGPARGLFSLPPGGWRASEGPCQPIDATPGEASAGIALQATLAHLATEALGEAGYPMLAPAAWGLWGDRASNTVGGSLPSIAIATTGGIERRDQRFQLLLDPDQATRKVVVRLRDLALTSDTELGRRSSMRRFRFAPSLELTAHAGGCRTAQPAAAIADVVKPISFDVCEPAAWGDQMAIGTRRAYATAALRESLGLGGGQTPCK